MKGSILILLLCSFTAFGKSDSLKFHSFFDGQVMIQTGNLKQFSTNLILNTKLSNSNFESNINASFQYVKVNDFNVINDFWSYGYFKYHQTKRLYPIGMVYGGFAKSFGINSSFLGGAGLGLNIIQKSPQKFLHLNVIAGYMNFDYF